MSWFTMLKTAVADVPTPAAGKLRLFFDALGVASVKDEAGAVTPLGAARLPGYIDGLRMEWVSGTQIRVSTGSAYIPSIARIAELAAAVTLTPTLAANTWYHLYLTVVGAVVGIEAVTTAPAAPYYGVARAKTGDTSRRYIGSFKTQSAAAAIMNFEHNLADGRVSYLSDINGNGLTVLNAGRSATASATVSAAAVIPVTAKIATAFMENTTDRITFIANPNMGDASSLAILQFLRPSGVLFGPMLLNASQQFNYRLSGAADPTAGGFTVWVNGYIYER